MGKKDSSSITHHSNIPSFQLFRTCGFLLKKQLDEPWRKAVWNTAFGGALRWNRRGRKAGETTGWP
jgi:hypothetical protein